MKVDGFLDAVCEALGREPRSLSLDDTPETVKEWDSVGHLSIVAAMEEQLGVPVMEEELLNFSSIRELVDRLRARNALED